MTPLEAPLSSRESARRRLGVMTRAELAFDGVTDREIETAVRRGDWVRLRTGVFVSATDLAEVQRTHRQPGLDALGVLAGQARPSVVLSHGTAAWVWGLPSPRPGRGLVRLTDPVRWRSGTGWRMSQAALPDDEVAVRGAYRVTTPARTVLDVAREWSEVDAVAAADASLARGLTDPGELAGLLARRPRVPGRPRVQRVVDLADGRAESWLETYGRLAFAAGGLPPYVPQVELRVDGRIRKVADGWYEEAALVVEMDGVVKTVRSRWGRTPAQSLREEKQTEDLLRSLGVRFIRLGLADMERGWSQVSARVLRELARPGPVRRDFVAVPRPVGRWRDEWVGDDGWLWRADDRVGGPGR